jgi:4-carboxymuconolactone decarboxylase
VVKERGEAPGPYKIILQNPNLLQVLVPVGRYFQQSHS